MPYPGTIRSGRKNMEVRRGLQWENESFLIHHFNVEFRVKPYGALIKGWRLPLHTDAVLFFGICDYPPYYIFANTKSTVVFIKIEAIHVQESGEEFHSPPKRMIPAHSFWIAPSAQ